MKIRHDRALLKETPHPAAAKDRHWHASVTGVSRSLANTVTPRYGSEGITDGLRHRCGGSPWGLDRMAYASGSARRGLRSVRRAEPSGGLAAAAHLQFLQYVVHVVLDGGGADPELARDLFIGVALRDER